MALRMQVKEGDLADLVISSLCHLIRRLVQEVQRHVGTDRALAARIKVHLSSSYTALQFCHTTLLQPAACYAC